jgi:DNA adenine methylase
MTYPTKPPFSYYGGKQKMAAKICALMPAHTVYVEPFCGSAAVFFMKGLPQNKNSNHYRETLNDTNGLIINFFRVMQNKRQQAELIERLEYTLYAQDDYKYSKLLCRDIVDDPVLMAWAWYVNVNFSFANKLNAGFGTANYSRELAITHYNRVERIKMYRDRLKCTTIMNEPALRIIERFDSPQTLHYVDPPYPETNQGHYSGFTQQDFEQLIDRLKSCKGAVLLSCYDNPAVPDDWIKHDFYAVAHSSGLVGDKRGLEGQTHTKPKRIECVWYKPASGILRPELVAVAERNREQLRINFEDML